MADAESDPSWPSPALGHPVCCCILDDVLMERVRRTLEDCGFPVLGLPAAKDLTDAIRHGDICLLDERGMAADGALVALRETAVEISTPRLGLLVRRGRVAFQWARLSAAIPLMPQDLPDVPGWVLRTRLQSWQESLSSVIRGRMEVPFVVREALVAIVRQPVRPRGKEMKPVRALSDIASSIGVAREHLSRRAAEVGISLHSLADSHATAIAIALRVVERSSWDEISARFGYRSLSGLAALVRRGLDLTLREAQQRDPEELLVRVARDIVTGLGP